MEEVETPNIIVNLSDKETNVNVDKRMHTIKTTTVETSIVLPPPISPIQKSVNTTISITIVSQTFVGVLQEPIKNLILSQ